MEQLNPGDLCVILSASGILVWAKPYVGRTVVLIEIAPDPFSLATSLDPFWRCSGMPTGTRVSHRILRKIPPERMLDARMHSEPVADKTPEKLHV